MNTVKQVIRKIPGDIPHEPRKASQGYIDDLGKKQKFELIELLERQEKLLANKYVSHPALLFIFYCSFISNKYNLLCFRKFVSRLPDKGAKILEFKDKITRELETRNKIDDAAKLLSRLNIASEGKAAMSELEWTGKYNDKDNHDKIVELDSDDEEDPLKILAQVHTKRSLIL